MPLTDGKKNWYLPSLVFTGLLTEIIRPGDPFFLDPEQLLI